MKKSRWSPADLSRQQLVVRRIALRNEIDLRVLAAARSELVAKIRNELGVPLAVAGCFVAGMMVVRRKPSQREASAQSARTGRLRQLATLFRTIALAAPAVSALFRSAARPVHVD